MYEQEMNSAIITTSVSLFCVGLKNVLVFENSLWQSSATTNVAQRMANIVNWAVEQFGAREVVRNYAIAEFEGLHGHSTSQKNFFVIFNVLFVY